MQRIVVDFWCKCGRQCVEEVQHIGKIQYIFVNHHFLDASGVPSSGDHESGEPTPPKDRFHKNGGTGVKRSVSKTQSQREIAKQKKFETLLNSPPKNLLG